MKPRRKRSAAGKRRRPTPHDRFFKKVFGRSNVAAELLRCYLPSEIVALLDLSRVELEAEAFVDDRLREHFWFFGNRCKTPPHLVPSVSECLKAV